MCYVPEPYKTMVLIEKNVILAISIERDEKIWEVKRDIDGKKLDPKNLLFSPEHQVILVCDDTNRRVLVLHPRDGSHLQTIPFPDMERVWDICMYDDEVILLDNEKSRNVFKLVFLSIS